MKKLWKRMLAALVLSVAFTGATNAQVPVTDVASITQNQIAQTENLAKWVESIQKYTQQIQQMKQQYEALTGSRGLGALGDLGQYKEYLPEDWQRVYEKVNSGGYKGLTGSAQAIADANALMSRCASRTGAAKAQCEREAGKSAQDKAFTQAAFDKAKARWDEIAALAGQINSTSDPKAIAELQARMQAESAAIANEQTKLQMYQMMAAAEDRIIEQQARNASAKWGARKGGLDLKAALEKN